jgi:hypothetical protein
MADDETPAADVPKLRMRPLMGVLRPSRRAVTSLLAVSARRAPRSVSKSPMNVPSRPSMTKRPMR